MLQNAKSNECQGENAAEEDLGNWRPRLYGSVLVHRPLQLLYAYDESEFWAQILITQ